MEKPLLLLDLHRELPRVSEVRRDTVKGLWLVCHLLPNHHHHYYHHKDNRPATLKSTNTDSDQIFIRLLLLPGGEEPSQESVTYIARRSLSASLVKTKILAWQIVTSFIYFESNIIILNALFHMKNLQNTQEIITQLKKDP